jgi:hypothetical protein
MHKRDKVILLIDFFRLVLFYVTLVCSNFMWAALSFIIYRLCWCSLLFSIKNIFPQILNFEKIQCDQKKAAIEIKVGYWKNERKI